MAFRVLHFLMFLALLLLSTTSSRELRLRKTVFGPTIASTQHVANAMDCWNALNEIRSCGKDIEAYFASGASDITPQCCGSISIMVRDCWPELLTTFGYTTDQAYILRGYCDATPEVSINFGPLPSPKAHPPWLGPVGSNPRLVSKARRTD